ncbi:hypothetical protein KC326_g126 [Hortaea werneckii]|nr:hypothetical protein KC326_g126 [Hortaea werneckii]
MTIIERTTYFLPSLQIEILCLRYRAKAQLDQLLTVQKANNPWEAYSLLSPNHTVRTDGSEEAQERASRIEERTWTPVPDCYGATTLKTSEGRITNGPYVRRHFGTSRRLVIFCACVSLFIIVGAVLGGVLGYLLAPKKRYAQSTSNLPQQVSEITGIAVAQSPGPSEAMFVYFQDRAGTLWERTYFNSILGLHGPRLQSFLTSQQWQARELVSQLAATG